ncbi:uncharacterized protein LOC112681028 [Sipha flava]|uniref:Uncharacterized protein LOC112681028 n=1 Tax=Sipha flava TaxID=143950 RepID=A0A8B8F8B7_9HEMI|nr:uncharacterized protein LOC112681028 [Sipha flava]
MKPTTPKPRTRLHGFKTGFWKRNTDFKIATWNVTSLYRTGASQNLADVLNNYNIKVAAIQEIRWLGVGQLTIGEYTIFFSGMENTHHLGNGFAVHRTLVPYIKEFNPVSERISTLTINTSPISICIINCHAPTEIKDDNVKDSFYDELTDTYEGINGNMIRIVIGDFNAKCGRETQYFPCIGKESLHCNSNDNGQRLIAFATSNGLTVSSTTFSHKNIHKATWRSPDGETLKQIDHILIKTRYRSTIHDVRSHRDADCDTDHYLVISKLRSKLKSQSRLKDKRAKFNLELLRDETVRKKYESEVKKELKENSVQIEIDVDLDWEKESNAVKKAAATSIGELKRSRNTWYNDVCRIAVDKRRKARDDFIKNNTQTTKEAFIRERKICKSDLQREKRKFFNNILHTTENDHTQGRTRNFLRVIKQYKQFNPIWNAIRDQDGQMLMEPESRAERWKGYFEKLLNGNMPAQPVTHVEYERPEPYVEDVSLDEVKKYGGKYVDLSLTKQRGIGGGGTTEFYDMLELTTVPSFIKSQRIQRLGHIMRRRENEIVRVTLEWKPIGKRPRGRPRKRWIDVVEEDLKILGVENWRETVQDRDR